jgi:hypothetical protein
MAQPIPQPVAYLIALNVEFSVLICILCKFAVTLTAIVRHLRDQHKTDIKLRKQVEEYIQEFPFVYDYVTVLTLVFGDYTVIRLILYGENKMWSVQAPRQSTV